MKGKFASLVFGLLMLNVTVLSAVNVGEQAPYFEYTDLEGNRTSLTDLAGNVIFIFVFGNECRVCKDVGYRTEAEVYQVFKGYENFRAIGIDAWDHSSSVTTVQAFVDYTGITYPLFLHAGSFVSLYGTTYDRVLVIDENGILRYKGGTNVAKTLDGAKQTVQSLLEGQNSEVKETISFSLLQNYPNPFNPTTQIPVRLSGEATISLKLYDLLGNHIQTLAEGVFGEGQYEFPWQADNYPAGVYFYRLKVDGSIVTRKMIYQK